MNAKLHACIVILRQVLKDRSNVNRFLPNLEVCAVMRKLAQNLADKAVAVIPWSIFYILRLEGQDLQP